MTWLNRQHVQSRQGAVVCSLAGAAVRAEDLQFQPAVQAACAIKVEGKKSAASVMAVPTLCSLDTCHNIARAQILHVVLAHCLQETLRATACLGS